MAPKRKADAAASTAEQKAKKAKKEGKADAAGQPKEKKNKKQGKEDQPDQEKKEKKAKLEENAEEKLEKNDEQIEGKKEEKKEGREEKKDKKEKVGKDKKDKKDKKEKKAKKEKGAAEPPNQDSSGAAAALSAATGAAAAAAGSAAGSGAAVSGGLPEPGDDEDLLGPGEDEPGPGEDEDEDEGERDFWNAVGNDLGAGAGDDSGPADANAAVPATATPPAAEETSASAIATAGDMGGAYVRDEAAAGAYVSDVAQPADVGGSASGAAQQSSEHAAGGAPTDAEALQESSGGGGGAQTAAFSAGQAVEAKFGNGFFAAVVLEDDGGDRVKVKYDYDSSVADLVRHEVRATHDDGAAESKAAGSEPTQEAATEKGGSAAADNWAEEEGWENVDEMDIGWQAASHLEEDDGRRRKVLEQLSGAQLRVNAQSGIAKLRGDTAAVARVRCLLHAVGATLGGASALAFPPPTPAGATVRAGGGSACAPEGLTPSLVEVPVELQDGVKEKLQSALDEHGAFAAFGPRHGGGAAEALQAGQQVEAKFGNSFFDAEVVEAGADVVKVRYAYDSSEVEVPVGEVRPKAKTDSSDLSAGQAVQAKFGNSMFDAEVVEVLGGAKVKVKYKYDGSEAELPLEEVKADEKDKPVEVVPLYIYGGDHGRATCTLQVLEQMGRTKNGGDPKYVIGRPDDDDGAGGITKVPISNQGRVIGKKGAMKKKLTRVTGAHLELFGEFGLIAGTSEERKYMKCILPLIQTCEKGFIEGVPPELDGICTRISFPDAVLPKILGKGRQKVNDLEDSCGAICFSIPPEAAAAGSATLELQKDLVVEGNYGGGRWHKATVVEVPAEADDPVKVQWEYDGSEAELPRKDLRDADPSDAERAARERAEKSANLHFYAVLGTQESRTQAALQIMGLVELAQPGTYIPSGGNSATVELSSAMQAQVSEELQKAAKQKDEESAQRWEQKRDQKWEEKSSWGGSSGHGGKSWEKSDSKWDSKDSKSKWDSKGSDGWGESSRSSGSRDKWSSAGGSSWGSGGGGDRGSSWEGAGGGGGGSSWSGGGGGSSWSAGDSKAPQDKGWQSSDWREGRDQHQGGQQQDRGWSGGGDGGGGGDWQQAQPAQQPVQHAQLALPVIPTCDPRDRLNRYGVPATLQEWREKQHLIFEGHEPLPDGWLRCWSRSTDQEYYVREADVCSVATKEEMYGLLQTQMAQMS